MNHIEAIVRFSVTGCSYPFADEVDKICKSVERLLDSPVGAALVEQLIPTSHPLRARSSTCHILLQLLGWLTEASSDL